MVVVGKHFAFFSYRGLVVEIQPLNCYTLSFCSPSNVKQVLAEASCGLLFQCAGDPLCDLRKKARGLKQLLNIGLRGRLLSRRLFSTCAT